MRLLAAAAVLLAAGCAEAKPAAVSAEFTDTVTGLLRQVGGSEPTFEAKTCGALTDPDPDAKVAMWADATVSASAGALRDAGVAAGWQPVRNGDYDLVMVGPNDVRLALRGDTVRAERADCSIAGKHQELDFHPLVPELTAAQADRLAPGHAAAGRAVAAIADVLGVKATLPAQESDLTTCGDSPRGATWRAQVTRDLPAGTDVDRAKREIIAALRADWTVDERPNQPGYLQASADGVELVVSMGRSGLRLDAAYSGCALVAGP